MEIGTPAQVMLSLPFSDDDLCLIRIVDGNRTMGREEPRRPRLGGHMEDDEVLAWSFNDGAAETRPANGSGNTK